MQATVQAALNVPLDIIEKNILSAVESRVPIYDGRKMAWGGTVAICASGPSLANHIDKVEWCAKHPGVAVLAIKGAHDYLIENGIIPTFMMMMDAKPDQVRYVLNPHPDVEYWVCTQSDPAVFSALEGSNVIGFHGLNGVSTVPGRYITGGRSTGVRSLALTTSVGFTIKHCIGFDCSSIDGEHYSTNEGDKKIKKICDVEINGKRFVSTMDMVGQAYDFLETLANPGIGKVLIYGEGLLPYLAGLGEGQHTVRVRMHDPDEKLIYGDSRITWEELKKMASEDGWIEMPLSLGAAPEAAETTAKV
jgi:hypothetical protein